MANPLTKLWRAIVALFSRAPKPRALPAGVRDPAPGSRDFLRHPGDDAPVNDPRADAWLAHLRASLPFPQPVYGTAEPPATPREVHERMRALDDEVAAQIAAAASREAPFDGEPDWFQTLADRLVPLAAWYAGVGDDASSPEQPERLRDLTDRVRRIPGVNRALEWLTEQIEALTRHNAGAHAAWFTLLKVHVEALLRPLVKEPGSAEVTFEFPSAGARIADLVPPPAPGSATAGSVGRVLCPSITIRLRDDAGERIYQRGAHVRTR